ncbi:MAG: MFS transporter [Chloroflexota bacterium]|nr:MFS transporter [Chloroflexota bacterium]
MRAALARKTPFYYGWVIVAFGFVFGAFNVGMTSWGLGVFVTPMQEDLGWDRSLVFLPLLVGAIVTTPLGIIVGPWADTKNGPPLLALGGILLFGASLLYMNVAGNPYGYVFIFGIVGGLGRFTVAMALVVVPKWFVRKRGIAQATVSAGFSVGPLLFPLVLTWLVETVGWRDAWAVMGVALIVLAGPGAFFIIRAPEDVGLRPDGDKEDAAPPAPGAQSAGPSGRISAATEVSLTRREALRTRQFWLLIVAIGLATLAIRGMIPNFQPFFVSLGFDATTAAASISAYAIPAIVMGFVFGSLADRHGPQKPFIVVCSIVASGLFLVSLTSQFQSTGMMFATMIYLGFGLNSFFVVSQVFVSNTFGRQHLGAIRGVNATVNNLATFGGPWLFGLLFDIYAEYALLFGFAVVVWIVTIVLGSLVRPLRRPPVPAATTGV